MIPFEFAVFLWVWLIAGGLTVFVGLILVVLSAPSSWSRLHPGFAAELRRGRQAGYKVIMYGILAPAAIPYWMGYGLGLVADDIRKIEREVTR